MHTVRFKQKINGYHGVRQSTPPSIPNRIGHKRYTVCAIILLLSALSAYVLVQRLRSQIYYLRAKNLMQEGYYGLASNVLENAAAYQTGDYKIRQLWGNAVNSLADLNPSAKGAYTLSEKTGAHYREALRLNPLEAQNAYGLAWQEDRLELLYTILNPGEKKNPHSALPYYVMASSLRPNGIQYHYALARYLHRKGRQDDLYRVTQKLARIYPPAYKYLKKEKFWSDAVKAACRQGLQEAVKEDILPAEAYLGLADMAIDEKDWPGAIDHLQQALELQPLKATDQALLRLGHLFLKNGAEKQAQISFGKSLSLSRNRVKFLERIYRVYKSEGVLNEFNEFYRAARQKFSLPVQTDILLARSLLELKQYNQARQVLEALNSNESTAAAYYWLARIADKQGDWHEMELTIQKATVLEPENNHYRQIFFNLLKKMKRYESAEKQLDLMVGYSEKPSARLFNEKAWLRWKQKDYEAAAQAWQSAILIDSDSAAYYARAAEAYVKLGDWSKAVEFYRKATGLDPENKQYKKRYLQILGRDS